MNGFQTRFANITTSDFRLFAFVSSVDYLAVDGTHYMIPRGAQTDLASIPKEFWNIMPPAGEIGSEYALAAALHDCCYRNTLLVVGADGTTSKSNLTKGQSDLLLKEAMQACGVESTTAEIIYSGVRLGGQDAFNNDR